MSFSLQEQEARTALLRQRARGGTQESHLPKKEDPDGSPPKPTADIFTEEGNINFFKDLEKGAGHSATNKEHQEEERNEKEKYEKQIGLLKYLGQDTVELNKGKEWYQDSSQSVTKLLANKEGEEEVGLKNKQRIDPINDIIKYSKKAPSSENKSNFSPVVVSEPLVIKKPSEKEVRKLRKMLEKKQKKDEKRKLRRLKKEKKKEKRKQERKECKSKKKSRDSSDEDGREKKKRNFQSSSDSSDDEDRKSSNEMLRKMRAERLAREAAEKKRTLELLCGPREKKADTQIPQKYNSQFNPQLARQNKIEAAQNANYYGRSSNFHH